MMHGSGSFIGRGLVRWRCFTSTLQTAYHNPLPAIRITRPLPPYHSARPFPHAGQRRLDGAAGWGMGGARLSVSDAQLLTSGRRWLNSSTVAHFS